MKEGVRTEPKAEAALRATAGNSAKLEATPGPWRITSDAGHPTNARITATARRHIAKVYAASVDADPVCEANAHLIAAAPELLEACKAVIDACTGAPPIELVKRLNAAASICVRAYAKATGRGRKMTEDWTAEEVWKLWRLNNLGYSNKAIGERMGRTEKAIAQQKNRMGLVKCRRTSGGPVTAVGSGDRLHRPDTVLRRFSWEDPA